MTDPLEPTDTPPRRDSILTLPVILLLGWIIVETTHMPGLAAVTMCFKFGWDDFRTAFWLRKTDPDRPRGKACFWLYLSSGLWRIAVMAILMMVLIGVLVAIFHKPGQQRPAGNRDEPELLLGALLTALLAFSLSSLATYRAIWFGLNHRVQFWLSSAVHRARHRDDWPPHYGRSNWASTLLVTVLLISFLVLAPFAMMFLFGMVEGAGVRLQGPIKALSFVFIFVFVAPIFILLVRDVLVRRIVAEHPAACWGYEPRRAHTDNPDA